MAGKHKRQRSRRRRRRRPRIIGLLMLLTLSLLPMALTESEDVKAAYGVAAAEHVQEKVMYLRFEEMSRFYTREIVASPEEQFREPPAEKREQEQRPEKQEEQVQEEEGQEHPKKEEKSEEPEPEPTQEPEEEEQEEPATCPPADVVPADGLTPDALRVARCVVEQFPSITSIGGVASRSGVSDHPSGRAIDFMIPDWGSESGKALGDSLASWVQERHECLGVHYIIWRQHIWNVERAGDGWRGMEDRGGATANHYDHVHVSVYGEAGYECA